MNFDSIASVDDGSCVPIFLGCTNPSAPNFKSVYTTDDGSCSKPGCTLPGRSNYDAQATFNDGTCANSRRRLHSIQQTGSGHVADHVLSGRMPNTHSATSRRLATGCLDPAASNYNSAASSHDGNSCIYAVLGCTDSHALNYLSQAEMERTPSDCEMPRHGCTLPSALNYDSLGACATWH